MIYIIACIYVLIMMKSMTIEKDYGIVAIRIGKLKV
jgi:hypothetical protein